MSTEPSRHVRLRAEFLVDPAYLGAQLVGVASTDIGLEYQRHPLRSRGHSVDGILHHRHHLVPLAFDVGEHGVGLVREPGLPDHPYGCGHGFADAAGLVAGCRADTECDEHDTSLRSIPDVCPGGTNVMAIGPDLWGFAANGRLPRGPARSTKWGGVLREVDEVGPDRPVGASFCRSHARP